MANLPEVGLNAVIANLGNFEAGAKAIQNAYDDINTKASSVEKATAGMGKALTGLGDNLFKIGAVAGGAALAGITALGAGIAGFAVSGISKAADLDQQIANIAATMGETKSALDPLKQEIIDLSLDPSLVVNATEAGLAVEALAQNGVTMGQMLDGAAKSTIALANAVGDKTFTLSANIATGAMQAFNLEAQDLGKVADGVTGVLVTSKFNADDYALALANAGGIAASTGVSLEDFNTIIAATASNFSSGSDAGTSLKTLLQRFANPTDEAAGLMEELGINIFDSSGNMRDMKDIVGDLHKAFAGMTDEQKAQAAATIGGADASRTLLGLAELTEGQFADLSGQVNKQGQALKSAATRVDSLSGAWEIFQGVVEAVQIQVGDAFLPILRQITVGFTDLASQAGPLVVSFFQGLATNITSLIAGGQYLFDVFGEKGLAGVFAALGFEGSALFLKTLGELTEMMGLTGGNAASLGETLQLALGTALSYITTNLFPMLTDGLQFIMAHFEEFKGALIGIGAVLGAGLFASLVAGIAGLVGPITLVIAAAGLLGAAWAGNWGNIQGITFGIWATIQPILTELMTWLQTNIPIALQFLATAWNTILLPALTLIWQFISGTMFPLWMELQRFLVSVVGFAVQNLTNQWQNVLLPALNAVWGFVSGSLLPLLESIGAVITAVVNKAVTASAGIWKNLLLPALNAVWKFIQENVLPVFNAIVQVIQEKLMPPAKTLTEKTLPDLKVAFGGIIQAIKDLTGYFNGLASAVSNFSLPPILTPGSPTPFETALRGIADAANQAGTSITALGKVGDLTGAQIDKFLGLDRNIADFSNIVTYASRKVAKFFEGENLEGSKRELAIRQLKTAFKQHGQEILGATDKTEKFNEVLERMGFLGDNVFSGVAGSIARGGVSRFISEFEEAQVKFQMAQQQAFLKAGRVATQIGNNLNSIVADSIEILNSRVEALQDIVEKGGGEIDGKLLTELEAQEALNAALLEQKEIQDDIITLKQNEAKLSFLEKQLNLVETINKAGLSVKQILGGLRLGLDASIPEMVEATNKLVSAMIEQVDKDLQISSPSKVMFDKMRQVGAGMVEGLASIRPMIEQAMGQNVASIVNVPMGQIMGGGNTQNTTNYNFDMSVNTGASPQAVIQQFQVARAMVS